MDQKWIEVKIVTTSEAIEPICGILYGMDVKGVSIEDPNDVYSRDQGPLTWDFADINIFEYGGEASVVKAYFSFENDKDEIKNYIVKKLENLKEYNIDIGKGIVTSNIVKEEDWANNWKKYYKPSKIGDKIVIKPIWEDYNKKEGEVVIELDPGMAFGTGTHETTKMCVEALEKYVKQGNAVFDIGTGSGILSIAASKLGARSVTAVDLDPVAVDSAKENVKLNSLQNVNILYGDLMDVVNGKANIIVANIIAEVIIVLSEGIKEFLENDGYFITSGIIKDRKDAVVDALENQGFTISEVNTDGEWVCIVSQYKGE